MSGRAPAPATDDTRRLREASAWLDGGDVVRAAAAMRGVSPAANGHPDALHLAARILIAQGRKAEAEHVLEAALGLEPRRADLWNTLGDAQNDRPEDAARAYAEATVLAPTRSEYWINLAMTELALGRLDHAQATVDALMRVAGLESRAWVMQGLVDGAKRRLPEAIASYRKALAISPTDTSARHNLAAALRASDEFESALAVIDGETASPATATLRAHLLAELGRFDEAVLGYRAALSREPGWLDAHETLSRLLPQVDRGAEALDSYRAALAMRRQDRALWTSAIVSAKELKDGPQLVAWSEEAAALFGDSPFFAFARALGATMCGDRGDAIGRLRRLAAAHPDEAGVRSNLAPLLIAEGELDEAEAHLLHAARTAPQDQSSWAFLTIVWRLKGDAREFWLADYERHVLSIDLPLEDEALDRLTATLGAMHLTRRHPLEQSPRGGTQTRGVLFDRRHPDVVALADVIRRAVEARLAALKPDPAHPFLSRLTGRIAFAGSWSVRLPSAGFHANHIHHTGWLSSACYVDLPDEVAHPAAAAGAVPPGALVFGVPDTQLGLDLAPRRIVVPARGRLAVFPSYFWHGTAPFESRRHRLTVAFDALPA